ncbi:hypothetical protein HJFPF1_05787 [Paramyrothecium foliicola]|nr:hypothetical protein HJFPF1_05787 [Paramyrothecium foliicola]
MCAMKFRTQDQTTVDPVATVFHTVELAEMILGYLKIRDLLRMLTVSKHIQGLIEGSTKLQRKLFFKPVENTVGRKPEQNPILAVMFPVLFTHNKPVHWANLEFLHTLCRTSWFRDPIRRERVLRAEASWRRMFPVQPPAKLENIFITASDSCTHKAHTYAAKLAPAHHHLQEDGLRTGLLFDLIVNLHSIHPDTRLYVWWQMFPLMDSGRNRWQRHPEDDYDRYIGSMESEDFDAFRPIFSQFPQSYGLKNAITLYHTHETFCCGWALDQSELVSNSSFTEKVKTFQTKMIAFRGNPPTYAMHWNKYGERQSHLWDEEKTEN